MGCSGIRAWNSDQCIDGIQSGKVATFVCNLNGAARSQYWSFQDDGSIRRSSECLVARDQKIKIKSCSQAQSSSEFIWKWQKVGQKKPIETQLYHKAQREQPEVLRN